MRPGRAAAAGLAAGAAALVVLAAGPGADAPRPLRATAGLPDPVRPAFTPGPPRRLRPGRHRSLWAPVDREVLARAAPDPAAASVGSLERTTPEGTSNVVAVMRRARDGGGRAWVKVRLAALPNGTAGWVPRAALGGYGVVMTRLVVDLGTLTATLYRGGRPVLRMPAGVGALRTPTPTGEFYVRNRLTRYRSPAYGPIAFGTSARSPGATGWPAGGYVGIHGTDRPDLIPGRISHGCIRLRNEDILALAREMPVGTPVIVR